MAEILFKISLPFGSRQNWLIRWTMAQRKFFPQPPLVSVVLSVFNGERQVAYAIEDILSQSYPNIELIISDDASTDGTSDILSQYDGYANIKIFRQAKNIGFLANKNFAINQAKGEFITQQDHDDRSSINRIERQVETLYKTGMLVAACGVRRIDQNGSVLAEITTHHDIIVDNYPAAGLPFFFAPLLFSRAVWKQHGPFDSYFAGAFGEDNYFASCVLRSHPIAMIADCLYDYVDTPLSVTSRITNKRALTMVPLLAKLAKQNREDQTNDLERRDFAALREFEENLLCNRRFVSEQYRAFAARAIDHGNYREAALLLIKAISTYPFSMSILRTAHYYVRRTILRPR